MAKQANQVLEANPNYITSKGSRYALECASLYSPSRIFVNLDTGERFALLAYVEYLDVYQGGYDPIQDIECNGYFVNLKTGETRHLSSARWRINKYFALKYGALQRYLESAEIAISVCLAQLEAFLP